MRTGLGSLTGHGGRAIAGQPVVPILVTRVQRVLDQEAAKSGAIDEEISLDALAAVEGQRLDESVFGLERHGLNLTLRPLYARGLRNVAQISCKQRRIELQGIGDSGQGEFEAGTGRMNFPV